MKRMDRYIVRELIIPFLTGSIAIALLFAANQLIFILKTYNAQTVPVSAMAQMIFYKMPFWLNLTLPAGISLAASMAITRLARESEITAMRAVGVRVSRVILPVAVFGIVVSIGNYFLVEKIMPKSEQKAHRIELDVGIASTQTLVSNVWINLKQYRATFYSIERKADDTLLIKNAVLGERRSGDTVTFLDAPTGTYKNGIWTFQNVTLYDLTPGKHRLTIAQGNVLTIPQPIFFSDIFEPMQPQNRTASELAAAIRSGRAEGHDMTAEEVQYYERFSVPAACIVFAIVAPIFALMFARTGSFVGVLLSLILVLLYYNAYVISTDIFGRNHWLSPWLAAWLPNFLFAALGLFGVRRLE
jgi:lipopolysaccharide export system permease protein